MPASRYLELVEQFPLRPIRSHEQLDQAIAMIDPLLGRDLSPDEDDYLDVLSDLVHSYESEHFPMGSLTQTELLQSLMDDRGVTPEETAAGAGMSPEWFGKLFVGSERLGKTDREKLARFFDTKPDQILPSLTVQIIQERLAKIEASKGDDEIAHGLQDDLYLEVLTAIANGCADDPKDVAAEAIKCDDIEFSRWRA